MTFDYAAMRTLAGNLLAEFTEGAASLIQPARGTGPAFNPGAGATVTTSLNAVAKGVSSKYIMRGLAAEGDKELTAAVVEGITVDQTRDKIQLPDGTTWKIVQDMSVPAMGTKVVWKFIIRR